ncbi:ATP-dependent endonuclease [Myxococcus sp. AM001]|nr:ATP-dependent endonuclease [Myxococcus sp. AM001]
MRLAEIEIHNFKGLSSARISIPALDQSRPGSANFISIIGRNNVGKSSILQAICLASPHVDPKSPSEDHFPHRNLNNGPIAVTLTFDSLTEADQQEQAVRAHIHDGRYRVRKLWQPEEDGSRAISRTIEAYASSEILDLPEGIEWEHLPAHGAEANALLEEFKRQGGKPSKGTIKARQLEKLKEVARSIGSPLCREKAGWSTNPGGISPNVDKVFPRVIYLPALAETKAQASSGAKDSALYHIADAMFSGELSKHKAVQTFKAAAQSLTQLFSELGKHRIVGSLESEISDRLGRFIDLTAELDLRAPDVVSDLAKMTSLWVSDGGLRTPPEHQGHGAQRALVLSLLHLLADRRRESKEESQAILLLVEEPEAYLHPQMCRKMRDVLVDIARDGVAQVICTTHSPVFLDLADRHDGIVLLRKANGAVQALQRKEELFGDASEERDRLRMLLNFDPAVNEVFFAGNQTVCLFEGDTELAALEAIAERLHAAGRLDRKKYLAVRRDITTVNCRGKWTIRAFQRVLNNFEIRYRVVHDRDQGKQHADKANSEILALAGDPGNVLLHCENIEDALFNGSLGRDRDKPWQIRKRLQQMGAEELMSNSGAPRRFLEFVLGCDVDSLCPDATAQPAGPIVSQSVAAVVSYSQRARRNLRDSIPVVPTSDLNLIRREAIAMLMEIHGRGIRVPQLERMCDHVVHGQLGELVEVCVADESMRDTFVPGDALLLKTMDFLLPCAESGVEQLSLASFNQHVVEGDVVLVAVNEDIEDGHYDLRRVTLKEHRDSRWSLRLHADNPDTRWGDRGTMLIYKEDAVRFLGKIVGRLPDGARGVRRNRIGASVLPVAQASTAMKSSPESLLAAAIVDAVKADVFD